MDVHNELIATLLKGDGASQIHKKIAIAVDYHLNPMRNFPFFNVPSPIFGKATRVTKNLKHR